MIVTRLTTEGLPAAERFTWWYEKARAALLPVVVRSGHTGDFQASAEVLELGSARITALTVQPLSIARTPELIRGADPECYQLSLPLSGRMQLSQSGRNAELRGGDLVFCDSSRPFQGRVSAPSGRARHIVAQIPKRLVPLPAGAAERMTAIRIPGDKGFAELLVQFLTQVTGRADQYGPADTAGLSAVLRDLFAATVTQCFAESADLPDENRRLALTLHIHTFIQQHLGDPLLTAARIAGAHHISLRSLHRLFQQQSTTVAAFVRRQRLEHACRDLADPRQRSRPIRAIAAGWGFTRPGDFTRSFRATYGLPPSAYRQLALAAPRGAGTPPGGPAGGPAAAAPEAAAT
ncbi:helix-turn-helix domain-containing protein [Streptomyces sp. S07_1.15]|uniref:AraC-like ligand-binding domain-containing protein n=1 Tax=Streptomyces sp. S07_1.15 TaxID=2873925 RepID=UPI001D132FFB|nr:helix-turn-helix domain-containing protein [Streptomyces sp. S07_1.15]MCC3650258.1 helix-turn-helix domain-containing protein [Streptomyces sp. S07_1.15]